MQFNEGRAAKFRKDAIDEYTEYERAMGPTPDESLSEMPTPLLVGYFLKVHSKDPSMAVKRCVKEHILSVSRGNEVSMFLSILKNLTTD